MKKANTNFGRWLELECKYGDLLLPMVTMGVLMASALVLFWPLFVGIGCPLGLALRWRWKKDIKNPPWYLQEEEQDEN